MLKCDTVLSDRVFRPEELSVEYLNSFRSLEKKTFLLQSPASKDEWQLIVVSDKKKETETYELFRCNASTFGQVQIKTQVQLCFVLALPILAVKEFFA